MKYALRPPSKRVNYQSLKIRYPFGRFDLLSHFHQGTNGQNYKNYVICQLVSLSQGVPLTNSHVYLPTQDDIKALRSQNFNYRLEEKSAKGNLPCNKRFNFELALTQLKQLFSQNPERKYTK